MHFPEQQLLCSSVCFLTQEMFIRWSLSSRPHTGHWGDTHEKAKHASCPHKNLQSAKEG